jgi:hypothetical protein
MELDMPGKQLDLLHALIKTGKPVVLGEKITLV